MTPPPRPRPRPRPQVVRAELVKPRFRLAVLEEHTDRVVMRLPFLPDGAVKFVARQIAALLPTLAKAARYRDLAASVAELIKGAQQRRR